VSEVSLMNFLKTTEKLPEEESAPGLLALEVPRTKVLVHQYIEEILALDHLVNKLWVCRVINGFICQPDDILMRADCISSDVLFSK
jgi:hypothetical protein